MCLIISWKIKKNFGKIVVHRYSSEMKFLNIMQRRCLYRRRILSNNVTKVEEKCDAQSRWYDSSRRNMDANTVRRLEQRRSRGSFVVQAGLSVFAFACLRLRSSFFYDVRFVRPLSLLLSSTIVIFNLLIEISFGSRSSFSYLKSLSTNISRYVFTPFNLLSYQVKKCLFFNKIIRYSLFLLYLISVSFNILVYRISSNESRNTPYMR